jgi:AcrR family transcriptional regulator
MKQTFFRLGEAKKRAIIEASLEEFGAKDFDSASLDGIIKKAGISKGGLYEYIESKEDLYLYLLDATYAKLYGYLIERIGLEGLPSDILRRFRLVSSEAVDFYIEHPLCVGLIAKASRLSEPALAGKAQAIFEDHYMKLFGKFDASTLKFDASRVSELLKWLLVKTRNDFLRDVNMGGDSAWLKKRYLEEWDFFLRVMEGGIYARPPLSERPC